MTMRRGASTTMGLDQYGETYHDLGPTPRATLLKRLGRHNAERMYRDGADGSYHVGYIIAGRWIEIFDVKPWRHAG